MGYVLQGVWEEYRVMRPAICFETVKTDENPPIPIPGGTIFGLQAGF